MLVHTSQCATSHVSVLEIPISLPIRAKEKRAKSRLKKFKMISVTRKIKKHFVGQERKWNNYEQEVQENIDNDWKLNNSKEEIDEKIDNDWIQIAPKEQRNIGTPFVVETLLNDNTLLNLPKTFEQQQVKSRKDTFNNSDICGPLSDKKDVCTIITAHLNSKDSTHSQAKNQKSSFVPNMETIIGDSYFNRDLVNSNSSNSSSNNSNSSNSVNEDDMLLDEIETSIKDKSSTLSVEDGSFRTSTNFEFGSAFESSNSNSGEHGTISERFPQFYCIRNIVIVIMESHNKFFFYGKLLIKVLYGSVTIYEYVLNASNKPTEVYSPSCEFVKIETADMSSPNDNIENVWTALAMEGVTQDSESELRIDINKIKQGYTVIVLQKLENNLTHFLKAYCPFKLFPMITNDIYYSWRSYERAQIILQIELRFLKRDVDEILKTRRYIKHIADEMLSRWRANKWSCTLIAGGKNVGKSTKMRLLINTLLQTSKKAVLLDVDPGQAECTPAGCISYSLIEEPLMGPNFTHLKMPVYQLYIDEVNVARCVTRYLDGIKILIERLKACPVLSHLPIVVNTMGFTQHIGWDLIISTIKLIRPSTVLQIISKKKNNYIKDLSVAVVNEQECAWIFCNETFVDWSRPCEHDFYKLDARTEKEDNLKIATFLLKKNDHMEPYQQRELAMISYLSGIIPDSNDFFRHNVGQLFSINEVVPYIAPFSSLCIVPPRLFGIPTSQALSVINGNIVALCGIDLTEELWKESENTSSPRVLAQKSPLCICYGFGIIRGVDMERQEIFINTPLPMSIMQHVNCLAGCIPTPPALLQLTEGAPYVGGDAVLPTGREPRRGYFRMKYQRKES